MIPSGPTESRIPFNGSPTKCPLQRCRISQHQTKVIGDWAESRHDTSRAERRDAGVISFILINNTFSHSHPSKKEYLHYSMSLFNCEKTDKNKYFERCSYQHHHGRYRSRRHFHRTHDKFEATHKRTNGGKNRINFNPKSWLLKIINFMILTIILFVFVRCVHLSTLAASQPHSIDIRLFIVFCVHFAVCELIYLFSIRLWFSQAIQFTSLVKMSPTFRSLHFRSMIWDSDGSQPSEILNFHFELIFRRFVQSAIFPIRVAATYNRIRMNILVFEMV